MPERQVCPLFPSAQGNKTWPLHLLVLVKQVRPVFFSAMQDVIFSTPVSTRKEDMASCSFVSWGRVFVLVLLVRLKQKWPRKMAWPLHLLVPVKLV